LGADLKKLPRNRDGQIFAERRVRTHDLLAYFKWSNPIPPSRKIAAWHGCEICFVLEGHVIHEFFGANDESLESVTIRAGEVSLLNYMEPHRNEASKTGAFISYNINLADHSIPTERAYKLFNAHKVVAQDPNAPFVAIHVSDQHQGMASRHPANSSIGGGSFFFRTGK
jgi:hypothetical protein